MKTGWTKLVISQRDGQLVVRVMHKNGPDGQPRPFEPSAYLLYKKSGLGAGD